MAKADLEAEAGKQEILLGTASISFKHPTKELDSVNAPLIEGIRAAIDKHAAMVAESGAVERVLGDYTENHGDGGNKEQEAFTRAAMPYLMSLTQLIQQLRSEEDNPQQVKARLGAVIEAIDANYLWERIKATFPQFPDSALLQDWRDDLGAILAEMLLEMARGAALQEPTAKAIKATAKKAKKYLPDITKIGGILFNPANAQDVFSDEGITVKTGTKRGRPIQALVTVNYDELQKEGVSIPSWNKLTSYDREVLSIVSSLYDAGNEYLSTEAIGRALSGNRNEASLTPGQKERILKALRILRSVQITINSSQEYEAQYNTKALYEGALLPSERIEIMELNGQEVKDCIHIFRASPLYEYAASKNQIARVDIKMLEVPKVNLTPENIVLRGYLIRQVSSMQSEKSNIRPVIRYDTLYEHLELATKGYSEQELRKKRKQVRDTAKKILKYWKDKGFIKGFKEVIEGRKITKINIEL